ncbi:MAG: hypothetical protein KDK12_17990 [Rhodobacteraceae bacterium]|nr:hypothetical protein [Paracoccaceae bacterium]
MKRRTLLTAGSAALMPLPAGLAEASPGANLSPIEAAFAEWSRASRRANARDVGEEEYNRRTDIMLALEETIEAIPAQSARDLALKILAVSNRWAFAVSPEAHPTLCAEIVALAQSPGDPAARRMVTA